MAEAIDQRVSLIGLTGGIGSGKSVVSRILRLKGYPVYDCDVRAKALMAGSADVKMSLTERFGEEIIDEEGDIRRDKLASIIFADADALQWLNGIVHRLVLLDIERWVAESGAGRNGLAFVESAILFTSGIDRMVRDVWRVTAPVELRLERVATRNGATREDTLSRMKSQQEESTLADNYGCEEILNDESTPLLTRIDTLLDEALRQHNA